MLFEAWHELVTVHYKSLTTSHNDIKERRAGSPRMGNRLNGLTSTRKERLCDHDAVQVGGVVQ